MSNHASNSKEILFVSVLSALLGGAGTAIFMSKEGKKLSENIEGAYHQVRKNIDGILHSLEKKLKERQKAGLDEKSEKWSENIMETIDDIKQQMQSIDLFKPKDLGMVILLFTLLGVILGVGATLVIQDKKTEEEDMLHSILSHISSARPLLSELRCQLNDCLKPNKGEDGTRTKTTTANDLLDFALVGLRLWERVKNRNR